MPFYHAHVRPGLLDLEARTAFSGDVVDVHCGVTGAPPSFVHLFVTEDADGRLPAGVNGAINGPVSAGRALAPTAAAGIWAVSGGYEPVLWTLTAVSLSALLGFAAAVTTGRKRQPGLRS